MIMCVCNDGLGPRETGPGSVGSLATAPIPHCMIAVPLSCLGHCEHRVANVALLVATSAS